jgi:hypothetical protein
MTVKVCMCQMSGTDGEAHSKKEMDANGLLKIVFV